MDAERRMMMFGFKLLAFTFLAVCSLIVYAGQDHADNTSRELTACVTNGGTYFRNEGKPFCVQPDEPRTLAEMGVD